MRRGMGILVTVVSALALVFAASACAEELPVLKVGHVGHDHQIALYVAADAGQAIEKAYGVWLRPLKEYEAYELIENGKPVAQVLFVQVGGGAKMPAAMEQGQIEVGLGGLAPVAKFIDKGTPIRVLAPLNNDGDMLVMRKDFPAKDWAGFADYVKKSEKPVRIGYKDPVAVAYLILMRALSEEGISYGTEPTGADGKPVRVLFVNLQELSNALPSLEAGIVEGVVVNEPMGSLLEVKGAGKIVANLSLVPPAGKWDNHPCCVVAATEEALKTKRPLIKAMLKVIIAGGDMIARDPAAALAAENRWTRTSSEVGSKSMKNITYLSRPDSDWLKGIATWVTMMNEIGQFTKSLKGLSTADASARIIDLSLIKEAMSEIEAARGAK